MHRYSKYYTYLISQDLLLKQNFTSIMQLPKIKKITLSLTNKSVIQNTEYMIAELASLELVSGRKGVSTKIKKSIAAFHVRKNQKIGSKITLRQDLSALFLEKLNYIILPRLKEFECQSNLGIETLSSFPELENTLKIFQQLHGISLNIFSFFPVKKEKKPWLLLSAFLPINHKK